MVTALAMQKSGGFDSHKVHFNFTGDFIMRGNKLVIASLSHKSKRGKLEWCDKDYVLLHACFELLRQYVEEELEGLEGLAQWQETNAESEAWNKHYETVKELYLWWTEDYLKRDPTSISIADDVRFKEENEKLYKLIQTRNGMWT